MLPTEQVEIVARKRIKRGVYKVILRDGGVHCFAKETPGGRFFIIKSYDSLEEAYTRFLRKKPW